MPLPSNVTNQLATAIHERRAILFAGAGLSISVGLPSWRELIVHMAEELGLGHEVGPQHGISYHTLAEYYRISTGSIGPLRSWMDRNWKISESAIRNSRLHELIIGLDFPLIYTTNYDRNIESAYEAHGLAYVKVSNARDIAHTNDRMTQIVKFHGDFEDDQSLVITETDYFNRLEFDSPLDIKFRSDALGKTVLFIGYSMNDMNIRLLLHKLWRTWQISGYERSRPRSFVFMSRADPIQEAVLAQWGLTAVTGESDDPEVSLTAFLTELHEQVSRLRRPEDHGAPA
ncbi:SIR2 family NAD-dependent protein deacylase [Methylobacterium sp. ID0610]|uniref:SIR2 family NAD-dependent protein deacylase n=1 Tax=Methylobacterium carpenticola TaxID=3344827 RepID=UPI0036902564